MILINGILVIDKPSTWTSHDVVAKLRGVLKQKRIGHGGTLDPLATGVLPIFIGRATRAVEFCENYDKEYIAWLRLGIVTDTQDITGKVISVSSASASIDEVEAILPRFLGQQKQIPPMYSAIKKNGKKLYELARRGIDVDRPARDIMISDIELAAMPLVESAEDMFASSDVFLRIACSKGTYIRTLCHDIGAALGCGATLTYLRRTKAGIFEIDASHNLQDALAAFSSDAVSFKRDFLLPIDSMFSQYQSIELNASDTRKAKSGALHAIKTTHDGIYRFYAPDGEFLLLGNVQDCKLKTIKSFFEV